MPSGVHTGLWEEKLVAAWKQHYPSSAKRVPVAPSSDLPGLPGDTGSGKQTENNYSRVLEYRRLSPHTWTDTEAGRSHCGLQAGSRGKDSAQSVTTSTKGPSRNENKQYRLGLPVPWLSLVSLFT